MKPTFCIAALAALLFVSGSLAEPSPAPAWTKHAERILCLPPGVASSLVTEEEWQSFKKKMRGLRREERVRFRQDRHVEMQKRGKERGVEVPERSCPPKSPLAGG